MLSLFRATVVVYFMKILSGQPKLNCKKPKLWIIHLHKKFASKIYEQDYFLGSSSFHVILKVCVFNIFFYI